MIPGLEKILSTVKTSYLPAFVLSCAVFYFCAKVRFQPGEYLPFHALFYVLTLTNMLFVLLTKEIKPLFELLWLFVLYLAANNLQFRYGAEALQLPAFQLLLFLLPLNWLYFSFQDEDSLFSGKNFNRLCFVLLEFVMIENCGRLGLANNLLVLQQLIFWEWGATGLFLMFLAGRDGNIKNTGIFFAFIGLCLALANMDSSAALCLFCCAAAAILFIASVQNYIYTFIRDDLTGVYSRRMYAVHSHKSFPLKFSIGVVCLDDYAKLVRVFGQKKVNKLLIMIINKIRELDTGALIYRYNSDEFILVFKNEDKKQSYEYLENIRRAVAGAEFVLDRRQIVKVTISAGVSEKKRSDADADVVLERTREVLQKAYKFTQNITSKA